LDPQAEMIGRDVISDKITDIDKLNINK